MKNKEIAAIFNRIADALEIKGESGFRVLAYRKAARVIEELPEAVEELAEKKKLAEIPGVGKGIAQKIEEFLQTGRMKKMEEALAEIPEGLLELLNIPNLGGKTIHLAYKELGVENLNDLKRVIEDGSLAQLYGLGEKKVENIKKGIDIYEHAQERIPIAEALAIAEKIVDYLRQYPGIKHISPAGSLRRMKETVGDIDILATGDEGAAIIDYFTRCPGVTKVLAAGKTKSSILVEAESGERQVDLRIVDEDSYGAALQYFTGSKAHNIKLRSLAKEKGLRISEYGVFQGEKRLAGRTEEEVYQMLGLPLIPPEMREDRGEVELALQNKLPQIVTLSDIKGDLHVHSRWSDGLLELPELVEEARKMGYEYLAICDHSQSVHYANGLSPERLQQQIAEIDRLNQQLDDFQLLKATEVDILANGSLDFPDELLEKLDFVVAAIHTGFRKKVTERMIKAMHNPLVMAIAHPSGRLISKREGYEVDLDKIIIEAVQMGVFLELNSYYDRLDLNEFYLKKAKDAGVLISIGTDCHNWEGLKMMRFGVGVARRAWLEKADILNCLSLAEVKEKLKEVRKVRKKLVAEKR